MIEFVLSLMIFCYVIFYWEVSKVVIDIVICEDNKYYGIVFGDCDDDDSDLDVEELSMFVIFLEYILRGLYKDRSVFELYLR